MSTLSSLQQGFSPMVPSGSSAARSTDTENGLGKVSESFAGLPGMSPSANTTPFSAGNPGFGSRGSAGSFSVSDFLG